MKIVHEFLGGTVAVYEYDDKTGERIRFTHYRCSTDFIMDEYERNN